MPCKNSMLLVRGCEVYAPEPLGRVDMFFGGERILRIGDRGDGEKVEKFFGAEVLDASGTIALPGFIDTHVHLLGGGGEGGFCTRTPEATLTGLTTAGVTTVVGVLGTDGVTRNSASLVAKIRGLEEEGISAWGLAGYYRIPFDTITGSVQGDLVLIDKFLGVGEVALSDHRSSQPTFEEFARLAADTRVGAMLAGKRGVVQCHMGDGARMLELIERVVRETEIPVKHFVPTHMNRNPDLFRAGVRQKGRVCRLHDEHDAALPRGGRGQVQRRAQDAAGRGCRAGPDHVQLRRTGQPAGVRRGGAYAGPQGRDERVPLARGARRRADRKNSARNRRPRNHVERGGYLRAAPQGSAHLRQRCGRDVCRP